MNFANNIMSIAAPIVAGLRRRRDRQFHQRVPHRRGGAGGRHSELRVSARPDRADSRTGLSGRRRGRRRRRPRHERRQGSRRYHRRTGSRLRFGILSARDAAAGLRRARCGSGLSRDDARARAGRRRRAPARRRGRGDRFLGGDARPAVRQRSGRTARARPDLDGSPRDGDLRCLARRWHRRRALSRNGRADAPDAAAGEASLARRARRRRSSGARAGSSGSRNCSCTAGPANGSSIGASPARRGCSRLASRSWSDRALALAGIDAVAPLGTRAALDGAHEDPRRRLRTNSASARTPPSSWHRATGRWRTSAPARAPGMSP